MRFGIIGTNWITDRLLKAAKDLPEFSVGAVYSRTEERGREFAEKYGVEAVYTDMAKMFQSGKIDAVYIASPNSFHVEQSVLALEHGIHVLCEKPAVISEAEMERIMEASRKHQTTYMEAMKSTVAPTFLNLKKNLHKIGHIRRLVFHFNQYSSRYDKYKEGIIENAFKPEFGNGAKMDLGVYCIAPIIHLVGEPEKVLANSYSLSTGADGQGSMILAYKEFEAIVMYSKITDSYVPCEIQGEEGVIEINKISDPRQVIIKYRDGRTEDLSIPQEYETMYYELKEFMDCVKAGQVESAINTHDISRQVVKLLS
ncbi:hypothetical protein G159_17995 [Planococcus glaciei CHR43]|uniref:Gfo/Idh/MocA family protein n=1 Tax=Planococcus glaciei TaxID=459472 RepID=UPI0003DF23CB|nr:Gfo/Idh/MocA family oxidoreductase [Planococcus glaciei]ETP67038.1 hypothetical protein G159_17995 [Planococcus glaciei CHR43]